MSLFSRSSPRTRTTARRTILAATTLSLLAAMTAAPTVAAADPPVTPIEAGPNFLHLPAPLSTSDCLATFAIRCYGSPQLHTAYDLGALYRHRIDGRGTTIVVAVPFGSPTIRHDLTVFDRRFRLPDPDLRLMPMGDFPPYDPANLERVEWAAATTLQVEYAHAFAPGARVVVAEIPDSDFPSLLTAETTLADRGIGDVFTQIEVTSEDSSVLSMRAAYQDAAAHRVTVLSPAGNGGPSVNWPSSDPLITSVGGEQLYLDDAGRRLRPDTVWNDGFGTSGAGGVSSVFARPSYQSGVAGVVGDHRGTPDITMTASVNGGCWIYASFAGTGGTGWDIFDGTGAAVAMFSGIVALADQAAGHRLGQLNPALYRLGQRSRHGDRSTGIVDVTKGNNSLDGGVTGVSAGRGYDLATGWGTVDAAKFVPALARHR
jgi:subtilase family serine protease